MKKANYLYVSLTLYAVSIVSLLLSAFILPGHSFSILFIAMPLLLTGAALAVFPRDNNGEGSFMTSLSDFLTGLFALSIFALSFVLLHIEACTAGAIAGMYISIVSCIAAIVFFQLWSSRPSY